MEPLIFFHTQWLKDVGIDMTIVFNTLFVMALLAFFPFWPPDVQKFIPEKLKTSWKSLSADSMVC